jgi:16S rRNA (guanine966-N2)-methyltransferase
MRIVAGRFGGFRLAAPPAGVRRVRPTTDRVRESLFNLIAHRDGGLVAGARVLDLFAGTGALGLEALSRGAACAVFVERNPLGAALIEDNVARLRLGREEARLLRRDAARLGPCPEAPFTLAFLDPPYGRGLGERAAASALAGGWLAPGATVVWEETAPPAAPPGLTPLDSRRYGDTVISLFRTSA